jgi:hypothetical protein
MIYTKEQIKELLTQKGQDAIARKPVNEGVIGKMLGKIVDAQDKKVGAVYQDLLTHTTGIEIAGAFGKLNTKRQTDTLAALNRFNKKNSSKEMKTLISKLQAFTQ